MDEPMSDEDLSMGEPMDDEDSSMDQGEEMNQEDEISFKDIQKLTGKLSQKIRDIEEEQPLNGKDVKYVINSILSALNLDELSSDDKEEIMSRFEDEDADENPSDYEEETDFSSEEEEMPEEEPTPEMEESSPAHKSSIASHNSSDMFGMDELKVENILKRYFVVNEGEEKPKKKLEYANKLGIKFVIIVGEDEMANEIIQLKNMETGEQEEVSVEELIVKIKN
jgi:hypothetical protein